ncbi:hypothetical protein QWY85_17195 [Neolewinella lacunae]|uniref:hypothetical protein n=1 Tax=Neolewinella lacunae TaxID=1517758 RepID=UPI001FE515D0|nr:hypothetical protein [Neolewinella lacunae]MDN3636405.1 hypothetical protein [Neolewinella lacunae]
MFECFEGEEVIAVDEHIFGVGFAVGFIGVFDEESGFEFGFFSFADPGEFEALVGHVGYFGGVD